MGGYPDDLATMDLKEILKIPSVGKSIGEKIDEFVRTGSFAALEELRAQIPPGVREMTAIPGLGPKKAILLYRDLGIADVEQLAQAVDQGRLAEVKGFGAKTEENIRRGIERMNQSTGRVLVSVAMDLADYFIERLGARKDVRRIEYAGSLRRMAETIGDLDLLVASDDPAGVMDAFTSVSVTERVIAQGRHEVVDPDAQGAAGRPPRGPARGVGRGDDLLHRLEGAQHPDPRDGRPQGPQAQRVRAVRAKTGKLIVAETEEEVYEKLSLPWIPPTLREDRGEVEAALEGTLPDVLERKDLRGDLHTHTNLTDGLASLEQMLAAAAELRYAYYAVTDHAPNLSMQRMTDEKMLAQREQLRALQSAYPKMTLLHGTELNIDAEGNVDWDADFLAGFDVCVASVHSHFNQPKDEMTRRIVRAMENPYVNVIGHPTGRLIGKRQPFDVDLEEVFEAAARTGTALEINGYPDRLDLRDEHILWARRHGVKFSVDTDSHATTHLEHMRYGVATAQRGWLTKDDVINAWPLAKLKAFLRKSG